MIKAPTGESQKVRGRIIAMVVSGPIPGRTPIAVPITQPRKHRAMFCHVNATPKPITMLDRMSSISERRPKRDLYFQRDDEDPDIGDDKDETQQQERKRAGVASSETRKHSADRKRQNEPERPQQEREHKARQGDQDDRAPHAPFRPRAGAHERYQCERRSDRDQHPANQTGKVAGAHGGGGPDLLAASEPQADKAERHVHEAGKKILAGKQSAHLPIPHCTRSLHALRRDYRTPSAETLKLGGERAAVT